MPTMDGLGSSPICLPTEVWAIILALSLPPPGFDEPATIRQTALARYARVCKTWTSIAESLLYAHPTLATAGQAGRFRRLLRIAAEGKRARKVKTLRVGKMWSVMDRDPQGEYFEVGELIQLCKEGLEEVVVGKLERVRVDGRFVGADTHLRALHFCDSSIDISPQLVLGFRYKAAIIGTRVSPSLSKVRHLTLCDVDANGGTIGFDRLFSLLPNLSSLAAIHSRRPYGCIPPHLKYLHASPLPRELTGWEPPDEDRHPARTERLLELYAVVEQHLARRSPLIGMSCRAEDMRRMQAMRNVPPSVRFLRFTSGHFFGSDFLTPFLSSSDNHLKKLEELVLPMRLSTGAAYEELREWCKKEGVRVVYEKDEEGEGTMWEARFWQCVRRWEKEVEQEES